MAQKDRVFQILDLIRAKQKVNVSELSEKFQVTGETIRRDLERLEREGYVETIPAKGTYVSNKNVELIREEQLQKVENLIDTAVSIAKISDISKKEIKDMIDIIYGEE